MRAIVLVGGEGTRLRPLTFTTPKQLLPIAGVPMIELVVAHLAGHGVDEVVFSMGYKPDEFLRAYPDGSCAGVPVAYVVEPELLDTAGAVRYAATEAGVRDTFLVVNGDVLTDLDVSALMTFHRERDAEATIALTPVEDPSRFGVVPTDTNGRVTAFIEKPAPDTAPTNLINAGTYVLEPSVVGRIPGGRRVSIERETFPALVAEGRLFALADDAYWLDTGNPAAYLQANLDAVAKDPQRPMIGDGVRIDDGAKVIDSVILDGAVVGPGALIRRSLVGRRAVVGEGAVVDELSVIGDGAVVAPGTTLVGARLPEVV